jgi:hypothetical protein
MTNQLFTIGRRSLLLGGSAALLMPAAVRSSAAQPAPPAGDFGPRLTPEMFGAMGAGRDDSAGLLAMVEAVNRAGRGHIAFTPGKTYLLSHVGQETLHFRNLAGLWIEGGGAILRTANRGCPVRLVGRNWGQVTIDNCRNVHIVGLTFDGNRANQTHTSGRADAFGFNAGLNFWTADAPHRTSDVQIRSCTFRDHGTLVASTDVRGDAIFAVSGIQRMTIEDCLFERVGRWAFALCEGARASEHIYFRRNRVRNENRVQTGNRPWGAVDIEDYGLPNRHIYIEDNDFSGTAQISYGGYGAGGRHVVAEDTYIRRNRWLIPAGANGANVPWSIGVSLPATYREFRRLFVEHNVVRWQGAAQTMHIGHTSKLSDAFIRNNQFLADQPVAVTECGLFLAYGGHMEGRIEVSDNRFVGMGEALANPNSWHADPSPADLLLLIERNQFDRCFRAFNLQFQGNAAPRRSSRIVFRGNVSRNTRDASGEYIDGGRIPLDLYGRGNHDKVWNHVNVNYR